MKYRSVALLAVMVVVGMTAQLRAQQPDYSSYPVYKGDDLGVYWSPAKTKFKVWAPMAEEVALRLYEKGDGGEAYKKVDLKKENDGAWGVTIEGNLKNKYYTFQVQQGGKWSLERPDPYAHAVGVNGFRGMVVDLGSTNPTGWANDKKPALKSASDIILYETHIRDISEDPNSGIKHKGKFLGLAETGTKSPQGERTGLDHIKELGVTHVHILPAFDFNSVDETKPAEGQYNWGYDPFNYNAPEGSYSTNPYDGNVRINEFKQMVQALHKNGLRVVLDVVYNHTSDVNGSIFTQFAPGYFYRHNPNGSYSNGTGCGNEIASERPMVRKFIIESVLYWAKEYHLDGFRFDLMGTHDIETMNELSKALHAYDPSIFIYGEGWTAGDSPLPEARRVVKKNISQVPGAAVFSDDIRDGLHGGWNDVKEKGFVSGNLSKTEDIKFGIVASVQHTQVTKAPWAAQPTQTITYVSCHDDNTLFDRLKISNPNATEEQLAKMDKLANAVVLTSQGVSFLHSGAEMLRTKQGVANSYKSSDSINEIDWSRKATYKSVFNYYKGLIALRKAHPAFRMPTAEMIRQHLHFLDSGPEGVITYQVRGNANGDQWKDVLVVLNGNEAAKTVKLPAGNWTLVVNDELVNQQGIRKNVSGEVEVSGTAAFVFYKN